MLTAERLREVLDYSIITGQFFWRVATSRRVRVGAVAGHRQRDGYVTIRVDGVLHQAHRLAVLHVTGVRPAGDVDHRNGVPGHDAWINLRDVPHHVNLQNQRRAQAHNRSSGLLGVTFDKAKGKFMAQCAAPGFSKFLGYFDSKDVAHAAYLAAKRVRHLGCEI